MADKTWIWIRGAGELASAVAHLLHRLGYAVFLSELSPPLAIRRAVTFSDAVLQGSAEVEGVRSEHLKQYSLTPSPFGETIPIFLDNPELILPLRPQILVDCRMLKKDIPDTRAWVDLLIGLGPGFDTNLNCHLAIETQRGHDFGRVIMKGHPLVDTGIPGNIGGQRSKRLIRAEEAGHIQWQTQFGQLVEAGEVLGLVNGRTPVRAPISGMIRGMISENTPITLGLKIGDVDPRGAEVDHRKISDKARMVAHGVLEAILLWKGRPA